MQDDKRRLLDELQREKERIERELAALGDGQPEPADFRPPSESEDGGGGILGAMDLSGEIRDVYLALLRIGDCTAEELSSEPGIGEPEGIPVALRILARQGYAEKYKDGDLVRYRAVTAKGGKKKISDDIWDMLG